MASLFAFTTYAGTLVVLAIVCFGLGRFDPKFGTGGSFVVMAVIFAIFLPIAALGFSLARRSFEHRGRIVTFAGIASGLVAAPLVFLCDWLFSNQAGTYLIPLAVVFLAGFASARLSETDVAAAATLRSSSGRR